jgi:hypothetical protein
MLTPPAGDALDGTTPRRAGTDESALLLGSGVMSFDPLVLADDDSDDGIGGEKSLDLALLALDDLGVTGGLMTIVR